MSANKLKPAETGLVLSIDGCIKMASGMIAAGESKMRMARLPGSKKASGTTVEFFRAAVYHFERLKKLENQ